MKIPKLGSGDYIPIAIGILVFHWDWLAVLGLQDYGLSILTPFTLSNLIIVYASMFLLGFLFPQEPIRVWAYFIIPSLLLRHIHAVVTLQSFSNWPVFFLVDVVLFSLALIPVYLGAKLHHKFNNEKKGTHTLF